MVPDRVALLLQNNTVLCQHLTRCVQILHVCFMQKSIQIMRRVAFRYLLSQRFEPTEGIIIKRHSTHTYSVLYSFLLLTLIAYPHCMRVSIRHKFTTWIFPSISRQQVVIMLNVAPANSNNSCKKALGEFWISITDDH